MPKHPSIRKRKVNAFQQDPEKIEERIQWLEHCKQWAVRQLSPSPSPQARNFMRQSIEQALAAYNPQSPKAEVDDVLLACVEEVKKSLETKEDSQLNEGNSSKRKSWIEKLKDRAIAQLPATASAQTKTSLRHSIDEALVGYGPGSSEREVQDIISMVVVKTRFQMEAEEATCRRAEQKKALMELADNLLELALKKFPSKVVGTPNSNQFYHLVENLKAELREVLQGRLSGDESIGDVCQMVKAFLGGWEKSLDTNEKAEGSISRRLLLTGLAAAAGAGITLKFPFLKEKFKQGANYVRTQVPWEEIVQTVSDAYQKAKGDQTKGQG
jgi:hypothetical protein